MPILEHARAFTFDELHEAVRTAEVPVLVDFWEPRCSACRATIDAVDALACRLKGHGVVGTVNVRDCPEAAQSLGVTSVPTLVVFREGEVTQVLDSAEAIRGFVERIDEEVFEGTPPDCGA